MGGGVIAGVEPFRCPAWVSIPGPLLLESNALLTELSGAPGVIGEAASPFFFLS